MNLLSIQYSELNETPIQDITHLGDPSTATNFTKSELNQLQTQKYQNRIRDAFKNTPFVFDIVFVYHNKFDASKDEDNEAIDKYIPGQKSHLPKFTIDDNIEILPKPGVITFVPLGNLSPFQRIPMTPWILAHKIAHAVDKNIPDVFYELLDYVKNNLTKNQFTTLFDFRSLNNPGVSLTNFEFPVELIALYLIKGKITANTEDPQILKMVDQMNKELFDLFKSCEGTILAEV